MEQLQQIFSVTSNFLGKLLHTARLQSILLLLVLCRSQGVLYTEVSTWGMRSFSCTSEARNYCELF